MKRISMEVAWLADADAHNEAVALLLPDSEMTRSTVILGAREAIEGVDEGDPGETIGIDIISATVPDEAAPARRTALEAYMHAHSREARYICVRSLNAHD